MQAFHFSLEKVLDHRKTIEQEAKRTYAQKQQLLIQQEQRLNTLTQEKAQLFDVNEMTIGRIGRVVIGGGRSAAGTQDRGKAARKTIC